MARVHLRQLLKPDCRYLEYLKEKKKSILLAELGLPLNIIILVLERVG